MPQARKRKIGGALGKTVAEAYAGSSNDQPVLYLGKKGEQSKNQQPAASQQQ